MTGMVGYTRESLNHRRDPRQGPEVRRKSTRAGTLAERPIDTRQVGLVQFRLASRASRPTQRGASTSSPLVIPATHALPAHPQGASHIGHHFARRKQLCRALPALFHGVEIPSLRHMGVHAPTIYEILQNVTLLYETH